MSLAGGARLGPYEIISAIGAGGMGEVYRARDTRLDRTVAIKVLPAQLAEDPQFRERFEREAKAIAALTHPHICTLYDVGHQEDTAYLVMEHLDGQTLSQRLEKGALPLEQALKTAIEVASALDKAHRAGIVHRDLKPGNIFLCSRGPTSARSGRGRFADEVVSAKLLDFGLAKSVPVVASTGVSMLPTTPPNLTVQGTILGTLQYMAPEQLEGHEADARTDIFAFGAVVYEMLTGRKAFEGKSQASVISAIMSSEPTPIAAIQPLAPPLLDQIVSRCLAKDPDGRWQSAADLLYALGLVSPEVSAGQPTGAARKGVRLRESAAWTLASIFGLSAIATGMWQGLRSAPAPAKVVFEIPGQASPSPLHFALSPDGTNLAAPVTTEQGGRFLIRPLDQMEGRTLPVAVQTRSFPFWSSDGRYVAYFGEGKLNKIDLFGSPSLPLCDAPAGRGGTWNRDNVIVFAPRPDGPLFRVSANGGTPVPVTELDKTREEQAHRFPKFLPDGQHFVFYVVSAKPEHSGLYLGALDSKTTRRLVASDAMGTFAAPNHLLFMRENTLMAQRFEPGRLEAEGDPFPVAEDVGLNTDTGMAGFTVSDNGTLAYRSGGNTTDRTLRWVDRGGNTIADVGGVEQYVASGSLISPDGRQVAVSKRDRNFSPHISVVDIERKSTSRFTSDSASDDMPLWSPDGNRIVFRSNRGGTFNLYQKSIGASGPDELLLKTDDDKRPDDWSRDGQYLSYTERGDIWILPLSGNRKPMPFLQTPATETLGRFSPDGRWMAYVSLESGRTEIYVQSFPSAGKKWHVSTSDGRSPGGANPRWRNDGHEIFYSNGNAIWSAEVTVDANSIQTGIPRKLFDAQVDHYDVTSDGKRFLLMLRPPQNLNVGLQPIRVVLNWAAGLKK